jgi:DNA topoisomerase IA
MAPEAVTAARDAIKDRWGEKYVPSTPRIYKNKAKNAQEAHECIRPTDMAADAETLKITDTDQRKLYDLIWKRTISSQMEAARLERTTVDIGSKDGEVELRATGQVVLFDGSSRSTRKAAMTRMATTAPACRRSCRANPSIMRRAPLKQASPRSAKAASWKAPEKASAAKRGR